MKPRLPLSARSLWLLIMSALLFSSAAARAGNGLNDIGYGAESEGMGGAGLAVSGDPYGLNINPAGLSQIDRHQFSADLEPYDNFGNFHRDPYGNEQKLSNKYGVIAGGGYAQRIAGTGVVAGVGFFAQGGAGFTYKGLRTAFGTHDDLSSAFGSFKIEPGLAWQVNDRLSLGATVGLTYSQAREKFFPETSYADPNGGTPFYGFRVDGLAGFSVNGKLGFQYRLSPSWTIAGAYTSKTPLKLTGGRATFDYDAAGLGYVKYRKASMSGLAIAQDAGIGIAFRPDSAWLIAADVKWVDWSGALKTSTLHVSNPDNPQAPQRLDLASALNWRDQYVVAVGAAYQWDDKTTLRIGANYGRNPVPQQTTNPLLSLTSNRAFTFGLTRQFARTWAFSAAFAYEPRVDVTYTNPDLPFGTNAMERWDTLSCYLQFSRRW